MNRTLTPLLLAVILLLAARVSSVAAAWIENGVPVTTAPGAQERPAMAPDGSGGFYVGWFDPSTSGVFLQRIGHDGNPASGWPVGGIALDGGPWWGFQGMVSDGAGGVFVGTSAAGFSAHRMTGSGAVAPGWPAGGIPLSYVERPGTATLVEDDAGGTFVAWNNFLQVPDPHGGTRTLVLVRLQRLMPTGEVAPGWPANGRTPVTANGASLELMLPDRNGGLVLSYRTPFGTIPGAITITRRLDAAGTVLWQADTGCGSFDSGPTSLYADASGAAVVGIMYFAGLASTYYPSLIRVTAGGEVDNAWVPGCRPFLPDTAFDWPHIVGDGGSGLFLAWVDRRDPSNTSLYASRVDVTGKPMPGWSATGDLASLGAAPSPYDRRMIADGLGGAIVAWEDARSIGAGLGRDIYAQRVGPEGPGVPGWPVTGLPVCTAPGDQRRVAALPDGQGGAFLCWTDGRNGEADIYAQRIGPGVPVPVLVSVAGTDVTPDRVRVTWDVGDVSAGRIAVARADGETGWVVQAEARPDGTGRIAYEDRAVVPGRAYGYRLEIADGAETSVAGEVWVVVPDGSVRLGAVTPNPTASGWDISLSLADGSPATVDVFDVQGRKVMSMKVEAPGAGSREMHIAGTPPLPPGVYAIALRQADVTSTARGVVVR